jgi:hypothetical protein
VARRREAPERDVAAELAGLPQRLRRFDPDEWPVGPPPPWWDQDDELPWEYFKARIEWQRAGEAWRRERGLSPGKFEVLQGAHGPGCEHSPTPYCDGGRGPPPAA